MHIVFSVDDLTESFWPPPPPEPSPGSVSAQNMPDGMTRSQSEWAFQRLLREMSGSDESPTTINVRSPPPVQSEQSLSTVDETSDVVEIQKPPPPDDQGNRDRARSSSDPLDSDVVDPNQYHAILKSKLEIACAAVARRVGAVKPEDSSASGVNQKLSPPPGSQAQGSVVVAQTSPGASSVRSVPSTSVKKKPDVVPARQTTSISSRDDSDDDDLDGDMETADNGDPTDVKRARRQTSRSRVQRRNESSPSWHP